MRLPFRLLALVLAALPATATATATATAPQPGQYDIALQLTLPRVHAPLPARQFRLCLTEKEIVFGSAYALSETGRFCTVSQFQQHGTSVRYEFVCDTAGSARMVGRAQGTRHPGGYDILMSGQFIPATEGLRTFTQTLRARRIGQCPQP